MAVANSHQLLRFGKSSTSDLVFRFILLDVLFFPYPPGLPVTFGVIAAIIWPIISLRRANTRYFILITSLIALVILSFMRFLAFSAQSSSVYFVPNFINGGILCFMAIITLMITSNRNTLSFWDENKEFSLLVMKAYIVFKSVLAIIFFISPSQYFSIRSFWTLSGDTIEIGFLNTHTRFTGTLSDPNNFACIMAAVVAFVVFRQSGKIIQNIGILLLACPSIAASMSVTGIFAFTLVTIMYALNAKLPGSMGTRLAFRVGLIFLFLLISFVTFLLVQDNIVVQLALQRVAEGSAESRFAKFEILGDNEKVLSALLVGEGATIIWNSMEFRPHIGHLYIFLGFGLPAYIIFLFTFFPVSLKKPLIHAVFLLPIFLGFSLNVGIYEPRFAGIWAILIGLYFIEPHSLVGSHPLMASGMQPADSSLGGRLI